MQRSGERIVNPRTLKVQEISNTRAKVTLATVLELVLVITLVTRYGPYSSVLQCQVVRLFEI